MPVSEIASQAAQAYSPNNVKTAAANQSVSMQDFFTLLAAQLQNQNMLEPVGDTEFLSQMAQFSALSATQGLNSSFSNFMAVSYIGKNIKANLVDPNGTAKVIEGIAEKVEFLNGETYITVDGVRLTSDKIFQVSLN